MINAIKTETKKWEIQFDDSTIVSREYYDNWLMIQYCIDIKKMSYRQILEDTTSNNLVRQEMMSWYSRQ